MELKPCPFCGGEGKLSEDEFGGEKFYAVQCVYCEAMTGTSLVEKGAVDNWNQRVKPVAWTVCWRKESGEVLVLAAKSRNTMAERWVSDPDQARTYRTEKNAKISAGVLDEHYEWRGAPDKGGWLRKKRDIFAVPLDQLEQFMKEGAHVA